MEKRWTIKKFPEKSKVESLADSLNIHPNIAALLIQRGIDSFEKAKAYFRPGIEDLHDPFLMKDMDKAVNRLTDAVFSSEKILIYGDYDVDGTTSVSMTYGFLKKFSKNIEYYIPDRYKEGYGVSKQGIEYAAAKDYSLIISLDCGIKAVENIAYANSLGIDFIVCDHHNAPEVLPEALAVLDPKRKDCKYPYKELSGCGVGFKMLQGFCIQNTIDEAELFQFLDLVSVSIASDIVPITGENRVLAYYGLKKLNQKPSAGLLSLVKISGIRPPIDVTSIVFYIGPRINAAGRLTHAKESVRLLVSENEEELFEFSDQLNSRNSERKNFDKAITEEALDLINSTDEWKNARSTVLFKNSWHKGVIGIVASRCTEHYYRPTIILTESNKMATGSARSIEGFDIYEAISECSDLLTQFGGHTFAAGLTMEVDKVDDFRKKFEEVVSSKITDEMLTPKIEIDLETDFDFVNFKNFNIISQMQPFGPHNMAPLFMTENVFVSSEPITLKETHLKLYLKTKNSDEIYEAICFGQAEKASQIKINEPFRIVYSIEENNYKGNKTLQLNVKDIKFYR